MKKLLVFQDGKVQDRHQLEDYLYDSEVVRSDFIDMDPDEDSSYILGEFVVNVTEWNVVFKGDDKYDHWHLLVVHKDTYDFEEPKHAAAIALLQPYHSANVSCTAVVHGTGNYILIYKVRKEMSKLLSAHIPRILESYDGKAFTYKIPEDALGSALLSIPKEEND